MPTGVTVIVQWKANNFGYLITSVLKKDRKKACFLSIKCVIMTLCTELTQKQ